MDELPRNKQQELFGNMRSLDNDPVGSRNVFNRKQNARHEESTNNNNLLLASNSLEEINRKSTRNKTISTKPLVINNQDFIKKITEQNEYLKYLCELINKVDNKEYKNRAGQSHIASYVIKHRKEPNLDNSSNKPTVSNTINRNILTKVETMAQCPDYDLNNINRAEKMTYCRPVNHVYTKEFINKTVEKSIRLQGLVKRVVLAREREKQNDAWNKYINELKNKHGYYDSHPNNLTFMPEKKNNILNNDSYIIKYASSKSNYKYENLARDLHNLHDTSDPNNENIPKYPANLPKVNGSFKFNNNSFCFPTSSQARIMMLNREKYGNNRTTRPYHGQVIIVEQKKKSVSMDSENNINQSLKQTYKAFEEAKLEVKKPPHHPETKINKHTADVECQCDSIDGCKKTSATTLFKSRQKTSPTKQQIQDKSDELNDLKTQYKEVSDNIEQMRESIKESNNKNHFEKSELTEIENKLDVLIQSLNEFMAEVKTQNKLCNRDFCDKEITTKNSRSMSNGFSQKEHTICQLLQNSASYSGGQNKECDSIEDILMEEMVKSNKVKRDIEEILSTSDHHCAVQINIDIPTKEHSTEVTDSLYKADTVGEMDSIESKRCITIAVNTDPLGLLALLRVSTESVKQILSYVPNIAYLSYIAGQQQSLRTPRNDERTISQFVCNICGASFPEPSRLSDHIQQHNLSNTRNCCVCRHVINMKRHRSGLFPCQHCGQVFTRAYCRQLHEQACSRRAAACCDVTAGLALLS